ncbi:hypothetical protein CXG81DRAFT_10646 [Caulochytrium protostelioides]|uniref:GDT1 family protein n=1 Tax=Caulochytrium protostelioides TaxID=1555241 RepID=A0A4V1IV24_9FUNG|nr:hypothetical protein CXG81DRAFT_10646 [Caulochytrium protostelioides]|eukprot:RKP02569.1 hypothetical protein CXG81DRAFT_10646 [Caulochytrium protostelioides]
MCFRRQSLFTSLAVIVVSEIGDKTFLICAVMAMRHGRGLIWSAAMLALGPMTVLSALLGTLVPSLMSRHTTQTLAALLFLAFGLKLAWEARGMTGFEQTEELKEVEEELMADEMELGKPRRPHRRNSSSSSSTSPADDSGLDGVDGAESLPPSAPQSAWRNLAYFLFSPVLVQVWLLVLLAEWGDRSQFATIALAGATGFWWVTLGGVLAHGLCTLAAVTAGTLVAQWISARTMTYLGAATFLVFGVATLLEVSRTPY